MPIRMRNNTDEKAVCCNCNCNQKQVLNMFDICIGGVIQTICDDCNQELLNKSLKAECAKNNRLKSSSDLAIISRRQMKKGFVAEHRSINE